MDKEFVPYEQALELKELGFDEPCFGEYRQWDGSNPWLQLYQDLDQSSTDPADYSYTTEAKVPTFSQAFRWFREKYEYNSFIKGRKSMGFDYTLSDVPTDLSEKDIFQSSHVYETYEEAELACLKKLIEIVKNK